MAKHIVFCADGTWNSPRADENKDETPDPTNVYKLFLNLAGDFAGDSLRHADEQEKTDPASGQVVKYIHGVGDSRNAVGRLLGGTFGAGVIARVVRGYTFISRNYLPGDRIHVVGFSRGAYTARALAGMIVSQGLLAPALTQDREEAYRRGAEAWYRYRGKTVKRPLSLAHLVEVARDLPAFLSSRSLKARDFVPVAKVATVAVWDTVGSLGLPDFTAGGERVDAFRFADTALSPKVERGFHAVALDERRGDFSPTLWDPATHVTQLLFPGAHSDVGGGYPAAGGESGLSDGALEWMMSQLTGQGVALANPLTVVPAPDPAAMAHAPWAKAPWTLPGVKLGPRAFPAGMPEHASIAARLKAGPVRAEPGAAPAPYRPGNRPKR